VRHLQEKFEFIIGAEGSADLNWCFYPFRDGEFAMHMQETRGIPYVQTMRGAWWTINPDVTATALQVYSNASAIVVLTNSLRNAMIARWPDLAQRPIHRIPNGGYVSAIGTRKVFTPHKFKRPIVLCCTNFNFEDKRKAIEDMVKGLERTAFHGTFVIAGQEGKYRPQTSQIGARSMYIGFERDRFSLYEMADIFWYHSYQDGQPTSLMEAMSAGLPCIVGRATNCGAAEFIEHDKTGLIVDSVAEGAEMVNLLLADLPKATALGEAARDHMKTNLTWKAAADAYGRLFAELLGAK
jgi:glycosyltransferase involved in cell wall biosynthesis